MSVPIEYVLTLTGALASVIGILFWELRKCAQARVDDAKAHTTWALSIQDKLHATVDKLTTLIDAQSRRPR